jgi:hypothetical protein
VHRPSALWEREKSEKRFNTSGVLQHGIDQDQVC